MQSIHTFSRIILFATTLGLSACSATTAIDTTPIIQTGGITRIANVTPQTLSGFSTVQGTVMSEETANIIAKATATVTEILVNEWDSVQAGQKIAQLQSHELEAAFESALTTVQTLENMKNTLNAQFASKKEQSLKQEQQQNDLIALLLALQQKAQTSENQTEILKQAAEAAQKAALTRAEMNYTDTKKNIAQSEKNWEQNAQATLRSSFLTLNQARNTLNAYGYFTEDVRQNRPAWYPYLSAKKTSFLSDLEEHFQSAEPLYQLLKKQDSDTPVTGEELQKRLEMMKTALIQSRSMLKTLTDICEMTETNDKLTQTLLTTIQQETAQAAQNIENTLLTSTPTGIAGIEGVIQQFQTLKEMNQRLINDAHNALIQAQKWENTTEAQTTLGLTQAQTQSSEIEQKLAAARTALQQSQLATQSIETEKATQLQQLAVQIAQAKQSLTAIEEQKKSLTILSPFSGVIVGKKASVGSIIPFGTPLISMSRNEKKVVIETFQTIGSGTSVELPLSDGTSLPLVLIRTLPQQSHSQGTITEWKPATEQADKLNEFKEKQNVTLMISSQVAQRFMLPQEAVVRLGSLLYRHKEGALVPIKSIGASGDFVIYEDMLPIQTKTELGQ